MVQPVIIAHSFNKATLDLVNSDYFSLNPTLKPLQLIRYSYNEDTGLSLENVLNPVAPTPIDPIRFEQVASRRLKRQRQILPLQEREA